MGLISHHIGMLVALWAVLAVVGLTAVVRIVKGLQGKVDASGLAEAVTRPLLLDVLPLIVLIWLTAIDPTHIIIVIWYYVAAVLVVVSGLLKLAKQLG